MRGWETPSVEPTKDGWVGFNTNSPHHFEAFLRMVERPDLIESGEFYIVSTNINRIGALRATLINPLTTPAHLDRLLDAIREAELRGYMNEPALPRHDDDASCERQRLRKLDRMPPIETLLSLWLQP